MISSHSGFQPLKEVWLGDCYPQEWYEHFDSESQDLFARITEMTKKDLSNFARLLADLGVRVRRPEFRNKTQFLDGDGNLVKPPITPRDWAITIGDCLYVLPQFENHFTSFEDTIQDYRSRGANVKVLDRSRPDPMCYVTFPSVVRAGYDLFLDCTKDSEGYLFFLQEAKRLAEHYRVHVTHTGDHSDGLFCPVAPGHIVASHYKTVYHDTFSGWKIFHLNDTTARRHAYGYNGRWWVPGVNLQTYNESVMRYAKSWIGHSHETVFEVNMLVIDEKNICAIAEDEAVCRYLESLGFSVHVIDFRCRGFWDGGLHCLTVDIHRQGDRIDYWPDRGEAGVYIHD